MSGLNSSQFVRLFDRASTTMSSAEKAHPRLCGRAAGEQDIDSPECVQEPFDIMERAAACAPLKVQRVVLILSVSVGPLYCRHPPGGLAPMVLG